MESWPIWLQVLAVIGLWCLGVLLMGDYDRWRRNWR